MRAKSLAVGLCALVAVGALGGAAEARSKRGYRGSTRAVVKRQLSKPKPKAKEWTPENIVAALKITKLVAWRRPDGATRYDVIVKNTSPKAYLESMGQVAVQRRAYDGTTWKPAGGLAIGSLDPGKTCGVKDRPFSGQNASQLEVTIKFKGTKYDSKTVDIGAEPAEYQKGPEQEARQILSAMTYPTFVARTSLNGQASYDIVVKNNTAITHSAAMGKMMLYCYQGEGSGWVLVRYYNISGLTANGTRAYRNQNLTDRGGNKFKAYVMHNSNPWNVKVIDVDGATARDERAKLILQSLTIESLTARREGGTRGRYEVTVKNHSKYAFNRIGRIAINSYSKVGTIWRAAGGRSMTQLPAGGTVTKTFPFNHKNGSDLKVKMRYKSTLGPVAVTPIE